MVVAPFPDLPLLPQGIFLLLDAVRELGLGPLEPDVEFVVFVRNGRERRGDGVEEPARELHHDVDVEQRPQVRVGPEDVRRPHAPTSDRAWQTAYPLRIPQKS